MVVCENQLPIIVGRIIGYQTKAARNAKAALLFPHYTSADGRPPRALSRNDRLRDQVTLGDALARRS
jgi:hypothetical protein